jgi:hypothetical protein
MKGIVLHPGWVIEEKLENIAKNTLIFVDNFSKFGSCTLTRWFIQVEPEAITPHQEFLIQNWKKYDKIFTYNREVLHICPNAVQYVYGTTWITERNPDVSLKEFKVSSITGHKAKTHGHTFRLNMYIRQHLFTIPTVWYRSSTIKSIHNNPELGKSKFPLFETFQFSLVIENSRQTNYFTEKLCDCLVTKTIPIYYGAPNIAEYFDTTGWIILENENVEEAIQTIGTLTPDWYSKYTSTIEKNYAEVQKYLDFYENLNRAIYLR